MDTVFHLAAYGGYMPEIAKFVEVNSLGSLSSDGRPALCDDGRFLVLGPRPAGP